MFLIEHSLNLQDMLVQKRLRKATNATNASSIYIHSYDEVFYILEMNGYLICVIYQKAMHKPLSACDRGVDEVALDSEKWNLVWGEVLNKDLLPVYSE